jgi:hypothetical protein
MGHGRADSAMPGRVEGRMTEPSLEATHDAVVSYIKVLFANGHTPTIVGAALIYEAAILFHLNAPTGQLYEFAELARQALAAVKDET